MQPATLPDNEDLRLAKLHGYGVLDTPPQRAFDDITALASAICGTPIALISLVDHDRQWFKSRVGLDALETKREVAFCSHAILNPGEVMEVEDATQDPRFLDNPLVTDAPDIRFYAGSPIVTNDGLALGTVCVIDRSARKLSQDQRQALRSLSSLVANLLEHERLRQEDARRSSAAAQYNNDVLHAMSTTSLDLNSFVSQDYVFRFVNASYLQYWNRAPEDIINRPVADLMGQQLFEVRVKPYLKRALAGEVVHHEAKLSFPALGDRHVDISYLPARNAAGEIFGVVVRAVDIQARKEKEAQLRQTVAALEHKTLEQERFIHIVSHDLREPINSINNFTSLLSGDESLSLTDTHRRYLDFVAAGGKRMETLLDDLLGYLQLERHAMRQQVVDLAQLAADVRDDLRTAIARNAGRVEFGHLPVVLGDPSLLRIALQNFVSNGLKFVPQGQTPVVRITATQTEGWLNISVSDNGIGIPAEQKNQVFDMFKRLHTRKQYDGTGLGLSICRRVAELHNGTVSVTSTPGQGSCFTLSLPTVATKTEERNGDEYL